MAGVWLQKLHPELTQRNCLHCLKYQYDENTGELELGRDDQPLLRLIDCGTEFLAPCRQPDKGCPKGTPEDPKTLWPENKTCYEHYLECKAMNRWPDDPVVARNAAAIANMEEVIQEGKQTKLQLKLLALVSPK